LLVSGSAVCSQESAMDDFTFCPKLKQRVWVSTLCLYGSVPTPLFYSLNAWSEDKDAPSKSQHVHSPFIYFCSSAMQRYSLKNQTNNTIYSQCTWSFGIIKRFSFLHPINIMDYSTPFSSFFCLFHISYTYFCRIINA